LDLKFAKSARMTFTLKKLKKSKKESKNAEFHANFKFVEKVLENAPKKLSKL
jgi:hypothetical protein